MIAIGLGVAIVLALVGLQLTPRGGTHVSHDAPVPSRPLVMVLGLVAGLLWFSLIFLAYGALPSLPVAVPIVASVAVACAGVSCVMRWSASRRWRDSHGLALSTGALAASMAAGFPIMVASRAPTIDIAGKVLFNLIAIVLLIRLARRVAAREATLGASSAAIPES